MKKKIISMILVLALVLSMMPISDWKVYAASTDVYDGTPVTPTKITASNYVSFGLTEENWSSYKGYYGIRTAAEMYGFAKVVNNGNYTANAVLLQDIALNAGTVTESGSSTGITYSWTPIGCGDDSETYLGTFDGNGCTISGLYINSNSTIVGLFGCQGKYGTSFTANTTETSIKNVTLANSYISGSDSVGGIVGMMTGNYASVSNCRIERDVTVVSTISDNNPFAGGIVGGFGLYTYNTRKCTVSNCTVLGNIQAPNIDDQIYIGAVVGICYTGNSTVIEVSDCYYLKDIVSNRKGILNKGSGGFINVDKGTMLSSTSDAHTCVTVTHQEVKPTCQYPGCSGYTSCLICGKITEGAKTVTDKVDHNYTEANCQNPATCIYCGLQKGTIDRDNHTGTASVYAVNSSDESKHDLKYSCCDEIAETSNHSMDSNGYCSICKHTCTHSKMESGICQICGKSGTRYLNPTWNSKKNKMEYSIALSSNVVQKISASTSTTTLSSGWYIVEGSITNNYIVIDGTVNIILADGATLNSAWIKCAKGNTLNIYAQSLSPSTAGRLKANSGAAFAIGCDGKAAGTIVINGGIITANASGTYSVGIGNGGGNTSVKATVTINGGEVTASGKSRGIGAYYSSDATLNINGGIVLSSSINAYTKNYKYGMLFNGNDGCIYGTSYTLEQDFTIPIGKTLTIESGKTLTVDKGTTLTIEGAMVNEGTLVRNGTIICKSGHTYKNSDTVCDFCGEARTTIIEIHDLEELQEFADRVNNGETSLGGKLLADIDASGVEFAGIGTDSNAYAGIFDGNGYEIKIARNSTADYAALFPYVKSAIIKNLTVTGTINTSAQFAGGILGKSYGMTKLEQCLSSVVIESTRSGDGTHGGLVALVQSGTLTVNNCGFNGAINGADTNNCGGFVGYSTGTTNINNSYVSATFGVNNSGCAVFSRGNNITITNSYYLNDFGDVKSGEVQKSEDEFKSGAVTWLLNGLSADGVWKQTIGTDDAPNFSGKTVYFVPTDCGGKNGTEFSNTAQTSIPHEFDEDGLCHAVAGEVHYQPAKLKNGSYEISNKGQLIWFSRLVNGTLADGTKQNQSANAILMKDIDLSGITDYTPIGTTGLYYSAEGDDKGYSGSFDGNGHVIKNLTLKGSDSEQLTYGIFGTLSGTVSRLGVENLNFTRGSEDCRAGGIVGQMISGSSVAECYVVNGNIDANGKVAGGLAGCNYAGTIANCYTYKVTVTASRLAGIVGDNRGDADAEDRKGTISNCYTDADDIQNSQRQGNVTDSASKISETVFASGEVTYKLNKGVTDGTQVWYQTLTGDETQNVPSYTGKTVYGSNGQYVNATIVTITGVTAEDSTYTGSAHAGYTGTPTNENGYTGTYEVKYEGRNSTIYSSTEKPVNVGDYTVILSTDSNETKYMGSISLDFTISPKEITVNTGLQKIAKDGELSTDKVTVGTLLEGHTASVTAVTKGENCKYTATISIKDEDEKDVTANYSFDATGIYHEYDWDSATHGYKCIHCTDIDKYDSDMPTAKYNISNSGLKKFINTITFGLFCKEYQTLEIISADKTSGIKETQYFISNKELSETELAETSWNTYAEELSLNAKGTYFVYVKVTDHAGNTAVYNTEGIVIFEDSTATAEIEYTKTTEQDVEVAIAFNGNTVKDVKYGDKVLVKGTDYLLGESGITLTSTFLETLAAREEAYCVTVSYHAGGVEWQSGSYGTSPSDTVVKVTIKGATGSVTNISDLAKTYDGTAVNNPTYTSLSTGTATYEYKTQGADDSTYTKTAPITVGSYTVRVTVAADETYKEASATADFTIRAADLTDVSVKQDGILYYTGEPQTATVKTTATAKGNQKVTFVYSAREHGGYAVQLPTFTEAGSHIIYYHAYADNHNMVEGQFEIKIGAANKWNTSPAIEDWTYGQVANSWSAEAEFGTVHVTYTGTANDGSSYESATAPTKAGNYKAIFTVDATEDYAELKEEVSFTIHKATLTVTAEDKSAIYGDKTPIYTVTYSGFQHDDTEEALEGTLVFQCDYAQFSDKGNYTVTPSGFTSDNYIISYESGTLLVSAKKITIAIDKKTSIYGEEIVPLTAQAKGIVNGDKNVYRLSTSAGKTTGVGSYDIVGTALDENYIITFTGGENAYTITRRQVADSIKDITVDQVTPSDKELIDQVMEEIQKELERENLTEEEKELLEEEKDHAQKLLDKIEEITSAINTDNIQKVQDVTSDNVEPKDKTELENAKADYEQALEQYKNNLTEEEKQEIKEEIQRIEKALDKIEKMQEQKNDEETPNDSPNDSDSSDSSDSSENTDSSGTPDSSENADSSGTSDSSENVDSSGTSDSTENVDSSGTAGSATTGDQARVWLWLALLFVSGGAFTGVAISRRKKKEI